MKHDGKELFVLIALAQLDLWRFPAWNASAAPRVLRTGRRVGRPLAHQLVQLPVQPTAKFDIGQEPDPDRHVPMLPGDAPLNSDFCWGLFMALPLSLSSAPTLFYVGHGTLVYFVPSDSIVPHADGGFYLTRRPGFETLH